MKSPSCCDEPTLLAWANGSAAIETRRLVEAHKRNCEDCAARASQMLIHARARAVLERKQREEQFAKAFVAELLSSSPESWNAALLANSAAASVPVAWAILAEADRLCDEHPQDAVAMYEFAVTVAEHVGTVRAIPCHELRVAAWKDLAWVLRRVGEYERATFALDQAEQAADRCADREAMRARVTLARSILLTSMQRLDEALPLLRRARATFLMVGDLDRYEMTLEQEANVLLSRKDGHAAVAILKKLVSEPTDEATKARRFANLAHAFELAGALDTARTYLRKACAIHKKQGATFLRLHDAWTMGRILAKAGAIDRSISLLRFVATGMRNLDDHDTTIMVELNLGEIEVEHQRATAATFHRLREVADYAASKCLPAAELRALSYLEQLGATVRSSQIRYVREFIAALGRNPDREFVPPLVAA